jgi:hypothetical protein
VWRCDGGARCLRVGYQMVCTSLVVPPFPVCRHCLPTPSLSVPAAFPSAPSPRHASTATSPSSLPGGVTGRAHSWIDCATLGICRAKDVCFFRLGSSGGIGVPPGTVVLTTEAMDGEIKPQFTLPILGKMVTRPTKIDVSLVDELEACAGNGGDIISVKRGRTMATDCFYEGQGRLDGAICDYTEADKLAFLAKLNEAGVRALFPPRPLYSHSHTHTHVNATLSLRARRSLLNAWHAAPAQCRVESVSSKC